ncbi:MAG: hypothetical protein A3A33_01775 [Candidatus Yanofskybacteria bacterium RIFCSPLOWO2_01_FULL_49_25]|uniref:Nudix hydrolase domain-containing protein n=1 Tax=Candidatus Yanofskybacteria bacterium RIFCSPLOWO2_01_FULL_49_25 TaxID=1802701 RepID=A0A1F8GXB5_9BACT|nr:MAG: hypothetical protein A3A33_01775 [Candidatus Yanofskybacteria bacterium RIFCSPLOWO2_01_FULL_49_25]
MADDYYQNLPKKRMGVGALLFDESGKILLVKPTYKDHWSIPGGVVEKDESPRTACIREIKEELGLAMIALQFVCVDYISDDGKKSENLQFIFSGPELSKSQIDTIKLPSDELSEWKFLAIKEALLILSEKMSRRLSRCLAVLPENRSVYLEDQEPRGF